MTTTSPSNTNYKDRIGLILAKIPIRESYAINPSWKPNERALFISVVCSYIDRRMGNREGWYLEFDNNYTKITKREI